MIKLRPRNKPPFKSEKKAQMSAEAYFDHAFEAIIFLYRHSIIDLRSLQKNNFPEKMSVLRNAFENGKRSGYRLIRHGRQDVYLPFMKLPIRIVENLSWPKIAELVKKDKDLRKNRTKKIRSMGKNHTCHWKLIANHYALKLKNKKDTIVENCNYCNVCKARGK